MAIEPLGSAMTYQAQTTQQAKQQAKPAQKVVENMDVATQEQNNIYDSTTVRVAETEKSNAHENDQNGEGNNAGKERQQSSSEQLKKAVEQLNKNMSSSEAVFGIHEGTNRLTIKIIDKDSKEVLKELPPEKILDMIAKAWELAGVMVDEKG
ncbi:flagellar protein FlaG [Parablautia muri]|uniref:Flagellar protein FlaG n=1 Tax=Parablautia muri TaxID=2320879 RepID=A0A9X5GQT3_9FIRM|nr:flagellar protein FlaG [Parablautia muri]NBJ92558.1 flagellar protein FlaG [Parablautia muri]